MRNFVQHGEVMEIPAPAGGARSGDFLVQGALFGVAAHDAAATDPVRVRRGGVYRQTAAPGQAWTQGQPLYWDAAAKAFTSTASGNTLVGAAWADKASADATGLVALRLF